MHKALQVELQDWQRDQEPDTDHEGFYQTSLPTIITQVNIHVYPRSYNHVFHRLLFMATEVDAGGKCPRCSDDWRESTRSNHTDGIVRDGEASQQVCGPISWRHKRLMTLKSSLLHVVGFERLWWNLGKSIVGCRTTTTGSTSTICWPPLATASSSSKKVLEKLNENLSKPEFQQKVNDLKSTWKQRLETLHTYGCAFQSSKDGLTQLLKKEHKQLILKLIFEKDLNVWIMFKTLVFERFLNTTNAK